jgi:hypothetical protein
MTELCENPHITLYRGDSKIVHIRVKDANGDDITTIDQSTEVRFGFFAPDSKDEVFLLNLDDDPVTIMLAGAVITVTIPSSATGVLLGHYLFEAEIVDGDGLKHTVIQGEATVKEDLIT